MRIDCNRKSFVDLCTKHEGELEGSHDTEEKERTSGNHTRKAEVKDISFSWFSMKTGFSMVNKALAIEARNCRSVTFVVFRLALALISLTDFGSRKLS